MKGMGERRKKRLKDERGAMNNNERNTSKSIKEKNVFFCWITPRKPRAKAEEI